MRLNEMVGEPETEWVEIEVSVGDRDAGDVAGILSTTVAGAGAGVELRADRVVFWVPRRDGERTLRETREAMSALAGGGIAVDADQVRLRPAAPECEWRDAWKRHFRVTRISPRIVIVPSWESYDAVPGDMNDVILEIDPGRAFGTGAHASTALCLIELDELASAGSSPVPEVGVAGVAGVEQGGRPNPTPPRSASVLTVRRFLDLGTGSAILAIAAAKLWPACRGLAIDIDPDAVEVATENVQLNAVATRVVCAHRSIETIDERFDLITANIQADTLMSLRDAIASRVAPGGVVILSGLLDAEAGDVARHYSRGSGLEVQKTHRSTEDPEWTAVVLQSAETRED